jgi:hypothetical protein
MGILKRPLQTEIPVDILLILKMHKQQGHAVKLKVIFITNFINYQFFKREI